LGGRLPQAAPYAATNPNRVADDFLLHAIRVSLQQAVAVEQ